MKTIVPVKAPIPFQIEMAVREERSTHTLELQQQIGIPCDPGHLMFSEEAEDP